MILVSIVCICAQCRVVEHRMVEKHAVPHEVIIDLPEDWAYEDGVHLCPDCRTPGWRPPSEPLPPWSQRVVQTLQQNLEKECPLRKLADEGHPGETVQVRIPENRFTTIPKTDRDPGSLSETTDEAGHIHHTFTNPTKESHEHP